MQTSFYNDYLKKIEYDPFNSEYDFSGITTDDLVVGETYVCEIGTDNQNKVIKCHELKEMDFEIRGIREFSPSDNIHLCSVKVLSYENGTEYPKVENVVVSGYFYNAYPEAVYSSVGYWDIGKDGRDVFYLTERTQLISSSENSVKKYLSSILKGTGVGKQIINKLFEEYQYQILDRIKENDEALSTIVKNEKKRTLLIETVKKCEENEKTLNFLIQNNVNAELAIDIIKKLGGTSYTQISNNPYTLLRFNSLPIDKINTIASKCGIPYHCHENIDGLILRYLGHRTDVFGDIYADQSVFLEKIEGVNDFELFYDRNSTHKKFTKQDILSSFDRLVENGLIVVVPSVEDPNIKCVYDKIYFDEEDFIVHRLYSFGKETNENPIAEQQLLEFMDLDNTNKYKLDSLQKQAVLQAFNNKLSIISGGPGSGKTFVTKIIVKAFQNWYPDKKIQLCAPTGKASRRMSEVIGLPACTIHKKLGYGTGITERIEEDLLIVDECSMIDIDLFYKLLYNIGQNTSVVLVGDYNQLPSVGPGLILRDLMDSNVIPCTTLKKVFRQANGSEIVNAANAVLNKNTDTINRDFGKDFVFIEQQSKQEVYENLSGCIKYLLDNGIDADRIQIITPQNEGLLGTSGLNNMMRNLCNPNQRVGMLVHNTMFYPGDRIIETENNSSLGIYNGSIGVIKSIDKNTVVADFDGQTVLLSEGDMKKIKLGYSITAHKSQGAGATRSLVKS